MDRKIYISNAIVSLVEYKKPDDKALYDNWQDPATQRGYNGIYHQDFKAFTNRTIRQRFFAMIMLNQPDSTEGPIIGAVGISPPETIADLAIWLFAPYRGKGYGSVAFSLATRYAIEHLQITELHAGAYPDNHTSKRMLKKCGYIPYPEGNVPEKHYLTGEDIIQEDYIYGGNLCI